MLSSMNVGDGVAALGAAPRRVDEHDVLGEELLGDRGPRPLAPLDGGPGLHVALVGGTGLPRPILIWHDLSPLGGCRLQLAIPDRLRSLSSRTGEPR